MRMFLLTVSNLGLAFCWGTEMTYCNPYLLSLGMEKSKLSLVWVAGPLSGFVMQPIIGVLSDKSTSKYGRRRPFMLGGVAAVVVCFVILGWTREIVEFFLGEGAEVERVKSWAVVLAVGDIFVLDFVINIAQSTCRALVVDTLPIEKQQLGSAWVSRQGGIGHLLVYAIGALDLNAWLGGFLGDTQFKKVCVIAALGMAVPQCLSCWAVEERVLVRNDKGEKGDGSSSAGEGIVEVIRHIYHTFRHLPDRVQQICNVQFFSWIGWFPFLFYGSTWVGEIYLRHEAPNSPDSNALEDVGRHGSMSMIVWSLISFAASIVLPWCVQSPDDNEKPGYTARPPQSLEGVLKDVTSVKPSLLATWVCGNLLFAAAMLFAPMVQSVAFATVLVALCGIPWTIAGWAPITFLGVEVNRMNSSMPIAHSRGASYHRVSSSGDAIELNSSTAEPTTLHIRHDSTASAANSSTGELSGIYLGILNIYTTLPQFVGTGISWVVFSILEPGKSPELAKDARPGEHHGTDGVSGIGVCLFIGAVSSVVAAYACRKLRGG